MNEVTVFSKEVVKSFSNKQLETELQKAWEYCDNDPHDYDNNLILSLLLHERDSREDVNKA